MCIKQDIATNLRRFRKARNLSQARLSKASGLNRSYISAVEQGEHVLGVVNLEKIAIALGLETSELIKKEFREDPELVPQPKIHGPTFMKMVNQCSHVPDAIFSYLKRSGIVITQ